MKNLEEKNLDKVSGGVFVEGKDGLWYQVPDNSGLTTEEKDTVEKFQKLMQEKGGMMGGPGMGGPGGPGMGCPGMGGPGGPGMGGLGMGGPGGPGGPGMGGPGMGGPGGSGMGQNS